MVNRLGDFVKREQMRLSEEKERNVTQVEVAIMIGVDPATLSRYINGKPDSINWEVWKRLTDYFKVPGHELFDIMPEDD